MTTQKAIQLINNFIALYLDEYKKTADSQDADGNYIPHELESKSDTDFLAALDFGINDAILNTKPITLIEQVGSTASEFKRISSSMYIRVPSSPTIDGSLDIDESLCIAVVYRALAFLHYDLDSYKREANMLYIYHNDWTRDYFLTIDQTQTVEASPVYFRYSSDAINWHDTFIEGDIFISFKQGDGVWSSAIKFVGSDGADGVGGTSSGASTFIDLTDTPSAYVGGKYVAVKADGTGIEFVDAPTSSGGGASYGMSGDDAAIGDIVIDMREASGTQSLHYLILSGDATIDFAQDAGGYMLDMGRLYTLEIFPEGFNCTLLINARGDTSIDTSAHANVFQFVYDGVDIFILNRQVYQQ